MKPVVFIVLFSFIINSDLFSQNKKHIVQGNDDIDSSIAVTDKFHYPSFITGRVVFRDGKVSMGPLNYNLLVGEVQFINPGGDTLALADEGLIKYISIDKDSFFYDNVYLQFVDGNSSAKLAKHEKIRLADIKKGGAFGTATSGGGIETYTSLNTGTRTNSLTEKKEMIFLTKTSYYIGDNYYHFLPATKKNVLRMFGKKKGIEDFLETNKINLNKEEDLKKLIAFLNEPD